MAAPERQRRPRLLRGALWSLAAVALLAAGAAIWLTWFFDLNRHRQAVAELAGETLGVQVTIAGTLQLTGVDPMTIKAGDVTLRGPHGVIAELRRIQLRLEPLRLLSGTLQIDRLRVRAKRLALERRQDGAWNIAPALAATGDAGEPINVTDIDLGVLDFAADSLRVSDPRSGLQLTVRDGALQGERIPLLRNGVFVPVTPAALAGYRYTLKLTAGDLRTPGLRMQDVALTARNDRGRIAVKHAAAQASWNDGASSLAAHGSGAFRLGFRDGSGLLQADWSAPDTLALDNLDLTVSHLRAGTGDDRLELQHTRLRSAGMPLPRFLHGRDRLIRWLAGNLAANRIALDAQGRALHAGGYTLEGFSASVAPDGERTRVRLNGERIASRDPDQPWHARQASLDAAVTARDGGKADAGETPLERLVVHSGKTEAAAGDYGGDHGKPYRFEHLQVTVNDLPLILDGRWPRGSIPEFLTRFGDDGRLTARLDRLAVGDNVIDSAALDLAGEGDTVRIEHLEAATGDSRIQGSGRMQPKDGATAWELQLTGERVALETVSAMLGSPLPAQGKVAVDTELRGTSLAPEKLLKALNGHARIRGRDLTVQGIDLNRVLDQLLDSQSVGLFDVGAYALLGPLGPLVTTGTAYARLAVNMHAEGTTRLRQSHTAVRFEDGVAHFEDTAFATDRYRVAVKGSIDLADHGKLNLRTAIVNDQGCARYVEDIGGTLGHPSVSRTGFLVKGVIQPIESVVDDIADLFGRACSEPFYSGEVKPPGRD